MRILTLSWAQTGIRAVGSLWLVEASSSALLARPQGSKLELRRTNGLRLEYRHRPL